MAYSEKFSTFEQIENEQTLRLKLKIAEQQLTRLQGQVDSLEKQLARAERTQFEKWFPIITPIFTALIALSAHFIAWRTDRRQSQEAELLTLKRQALEQYYPEYQQIREKTGTIIMPCSQELQRYSRAIPSDDLKNTYG